MRPSDDLDFFRGLALAFAFSVPCWLAIGWLAWRAVCW